ncbi:radical SAM protein [uncultured Ligilactobacillus sp.]|uniref:radical SAM protein n=1 Tax=uncultured Ligilactobacillus sp. TaxID=2837633 RepID=UPI00272B5FA7|nr:radical SAM protein [uncultured Ligilactobacillus sp.]
MKRSILSPALLVLTVLAVILSVWGPEALATYTDRRILNQIKTQEEETGGEGCREVVLTGIHISSYGMDFPEGDGCGSGGLIGLVEQVHGIPGLERIRLGSLEPRIITPAAAERLAALPKLCPHFHLSLQSGCDATLKRMNRHYTTGEYFESVESLRKCFSHPAVTTDVIVGFPGETEEEFGCTREFLEKDGVVHIDVLPTDFVGVRIDER